ncbi:MAG: hypothetical protein WBF31_09975, partial [Anaerolineae bacterium]
AGLAILDLSDPAHPQRLAAFDTPGWASGLALVDDLLFVADGYYGGLQILDVRDPRQPTAAGAFATPGQASGITVRGRPADAAGALAYVADGEAGLLVLRVRETPALPDRLYLPRL